jgi:hypothetical protein
MTAREVIARMLVPIAPDPRAEADGILAALREAGLAVVPDAENMTREQELAGIRIALASDIIGENGWPRYIRRLYRAMLAAAEKEA